MKIGTVYDITFSTNRADTGAIANADSLPIVRVTENGVNLAYLPTVSNLSTGVYLVTIDASLANGFEVGKRYSVYVTATVNGINGANGLDSFTIETRGIDDVLPTSSYSVPPTAVAIRTEIETSAVLARETTVASRASQASVSAIPTNPLLTTDIRLDNLDAPISGAGGGSGGLTQEEHDRLFGTATRGDVNYKPSLSFEEKKKLFDMIDQIMKKEIKTDTTVFESAVNSIKGMFSGLARKEDVKVTMNIPKDERIGVLENAISGLTPYLKPDDRLSGILQTLETISNKELDKEAIAEIEKKIQGVQKEDMKAIEMLVSETLKIAIEHLFDRMFPDKTPLHNKLFDLWVNK